MFIIECCLRQAVKEFNKPCLQRILGSNDEQTIILDELLENF